MNRAEYQTFRASWKYKTPQCLWLAAFIVGNLGQMLAILAFHNRLEANILFITGIAMMLPFLAVLLYLLHKGRQELRRIEIELIVYDTLFKLSYPKAYQRRKDIKDVERLFKK